VAAGLVFLVRGDDSAERSRAAVGAFAAAWTSGDDARAGALTDRAAAATKALKANRAGLDGARVRVVPGPLKVNDGRATGRLRITWQVPAIGAFAYTAPVTAVKAADRWRVHFAPAVIHPRLTGATRLGTDSARPARADILDRDGHPLVRQRAVVRVGLQRDKVSDVRQSADALADVLDIDADALAKALDGAGPKQFVEAQTLRKSDYEAVKARLDGVPGLLAVDGEAPLAPTRGFGRAVLGGVAPGDRRAGGEVSRQDRARPAGGSVGPTTRLR
jgi:hypothetical protein